MPPHVEDSLAVGTIVPDRQYHALSRRGSGETPSAVGVFFFTQTHAKKDGGRGVDESEGEGVSLTTLKTA